MKLGRLQPRVRARAGLTIVELVVTSGILAILLLASAAAMGESVEATVLSKRLTNASHFLESVQEDLSTVPVNSLLAMNGQVVYSHDDWANAPFRVEITTFVAAVGLLQVEMALVDQSRGRTIATAYTLRANA